MHEALGGELRELFINVADKELVPLLREKRFKKLKEAATWVDDHVLAHRPVQTSGGHGGGKGGYEKEHGGAGGGVVTTQVYHKIHFL